MDIFNQIIFEFLLQIFLSIFNEIIFEFLLQIFLSGFKKGKFVSCCLDLSLIWSNVN